MRLRFAMRLLCQVGLKVFSIFTIFTDEREALLNVAERTQRNVSIVTDEHNETLVTIRPLDEDSFGALKIVCVERSIKYRTLNRKEHETHFATFDSRRSECV